MLFPASPISPLSERISQLERRSGGHLDVTKGSMRRRSMGFDETIKIEVSETKSTVWVVLFIGLGVFHLMYWSGNSSIAV
jgi:hypothetical protein